MTRCRHCLHAEGHHQYGRACSLEFCETCPGWDPRAPGEPPNPESRYFKGKRTPEGCVVKLVNRYDESATGIDEWEHDLPPRLDLWNHSPSGFEWGYGGSGPAQLALAILAQVLDDNTAMRLHQRFKQDYVAKIAREGDEEWTIEEFAVVEWYDRIRTELT